MTKPPREALLRQTEEFVLPNTFTELPTTDPAHVAFVPVEILHVRLSFDKAPGGPADFKASVARINIEDPKNGDAEVADFATGLQNKRALEGALMPMPTPYDIPVKKQGYVVLELEDDTNWCFMRGELGVTTKEYYSDSSFGVRFVDEAGGLTGLGDRAPQKRSRILFFAVAERKAQTAYGFNFKIEFFWPPNGSTILYHLPTIFDPNIPDNGSGGIP